MKSDYTKITLYVNDGKRFPCGATIRMRYNGSSHSASAEGPDFDAAVASAIRKLKLKLGLPEWMIEEYLQLADIQFPLDEGDE